jgi:hypothetical protein
MSKDIENKIIDLNAQGFSNKEITDMLVLKKHTVKNVIQKLGLKSNVEGSYFPISETHGRCWSCKLEIQKSNFEVFIINNKNNEKIEWIDGRCKNCRYKKREGRRQSRLRSDIKYYLSQKFLYCKSRAKRERLNFDLSKEYLIEQYNNQNGLCFYSDRKMINSTAINKCNETISIDKIVPSLGYIKGNIVFCCYKINLIKNNCSLNDIKEWMPGWYSRIENFLKINII